MSTYEAPHVMGMAFCVLLAFEKYVHIHEGLATFVRFVAPSMFGVYLFHDVTSFGPLLYQVPEKWLVENTALPLAVVIIACALSTFFIACVADLFRRTIFATTITLADRIRQAVH